MQDVGEVGFETELFEPLFCELPPLEEDAPLTRTEVVIASVGAWLAERFASTGSPAFFEDGRLSAHSADLRHAPLVH